MNDIHSSNHKGAGGHPEVIFKCMYVRTHALDTKIDLLILD